MYLSEQVDKRIIFGYVVRENAEWLVSVIPTKKKENACYGSSKATDLLIFKEYFVGDKKTPVIYQVSIDSTIIAVYEVHINLDTGIDEFN